MNRQYYFAAKAEVELNFTVTGLIDTQSAGDMVGDVPEQKETRRASRYDAVIATFVGFLALCVSGYTAYMQRQQVRAAVWPILEFDSGNGPIHFSLANKGVGPAIIKHVILKVDDQPVKNWAEVLEKILGPGYHPGEESDMSGRVFSAGESTNVFTPHDGANNPIPFDKSNPLWAKLNTDRSRVTVEICYCSTLGECWILRGGGTTLSTTTSTRRCPTRSAITFQQ
ncbi:MAG: hypothetical protein AUH08_07835 [Verrucomicrobia bacterium 13_2_20CM_54_12]|nr:MAG: hypothetical protein AUH08_07835 [Verrucomicrobia bacterium 13_2_20CM_54_12]